MKCQECKEWVIIPAQASDRGDREMERLGYKNCLKNPDKLASGMFYHYGFTCDKENKKC